MWSRFAGGGAQGAAASQNRWRNAHGAVPSLKHIKQLSWSQEQIESSCCPGGYGPEHVEQSLSWSTWSSCYAAPSAPGNSWSMCSSRAAGPCAPTELLCALRGRSCCFPRADGSSDIAAAPCAPGQQLLGALRQEELLALDKYSDSRPLNWSITPVCSAECALAEQLYMLHESSCCMCSVLSLCVVCC